LIPIALVEHLATGPQDLHTITPARRNFCMGHLHAKINLEPSRHKHVRELLWRLPHKETAVLFTKHTLLSTEESCIHCIVQHHVADACHGAMLLEVWHDKAIVTILS
jgi:hypothetical protein